jgi:hypothetical protein
MGVPMLVDILLLPAEIDSLATAPDILFRNLPPKIPPPFARVQFV